MLSSPYQVTVKAPKNGDPPPATTSSGDFLVYTSPGRAAVYNISSIQAKGNYSTNVTCVGYNPDVLGNPYPSYLRGQAELWVIVILYFLCFYLMYECVCVCASNGIHPREFRVLKCVYHVQVRVLLLWMPWSSRILLIDVMCFVKFYARVLSCGCLLLHLHRRSFQF